MLRHKHCIRSEVRSANASHASRVKSTGLSEAPAAGPSRPRRWKRAARQGRKANLDLGTPEEEA